MSLDLQVFYFLSYNSQHCKKLIRKLGNHFWLQLLQWTQSAFILLLSYRRHFVVRYLLKRWDHNVLGCDENLIRHRIKIYCDSGSLALSMQSHFFVRCRLRRQHFGRRCGTSSRKFIPPELSRRTCLPITVWRMKDYFHVVSANVFTYYYYSCV